MNMREYKRVRYQKSPLIEVIFQLRFPTILSINAKQPIEFQDKIREKYPFYQEGDEQQNEMVIDQNGNPVQIKTSNSKNYAFVSADGSNKINLTSSFISISTLKYTQWEDLKSISNLLFRFLKRYTSQLFTLEWASDMLML